MRFIMTFCALLTAALFVPSLGGAQTSDADRESDRGFIQGLLEDALSNDDMTVMLNGFQGALSSRATIASITIADPQGVWLEATNVAMQWNRRALVRGRIEIDEISLETLEVRRKPGATTSEELPDPEAKAPFALPDLPVSVELRQLLVERAIIAEAVAGEAAELRVEGSASLAGGEGTAQLTIDRLDQGGQIALSGSYSNATGNLTVDLDAREPEGGLAVRLLGVPGAPAVELTLTGNGPLDDFAADLRLATDGEERLAGNILLRGEGDAGGRRFRVDIGGDIAPLLVPQYREFLGDDVSLVAEVVQGADGTIELSEMTLGAQALELNGYALIAADRWPSRLDLTGRVFAPEGDVVVLPFGGGKTSVGGVDLVVAFDAAEGNEWQLNAEVRDAGVTGLGRMQRVALTGSGEIDRDQTRVTGAVDLAATGITLQDEGLARAVGNTLDGALAFDWQPGQPLVLSGIDLAGADYGLAGNVTISGTGELNPVIAPDLRLRADDLARFAGLAGVDLDGAAALEVAGRIEPVTGAFDITLDGTTTELATGIQQADALLAGAGEVRVRAARDETGINVEELRVATPAALIEGTAQVRSENSAAQLTASVFETSVVLPELTGRSDLTIDALQQGARWKLDVGGTLPGAAAVNFAGFVVPQSATGPDIQGRLEANVSRLEAFSDLAGRALTGSAELVVDGQGSVGSKTFDGTVTAQTVNVSASIPAIDPLLQGRSDLKVDAARDGTGVITVREFSLNGRVIADFVGTINPESETGPDVDGRLFARVPDLSDFSGLAGRRLGGAAEITAEGSGSVKAGVFDATVRAQTDDVVTSIPALDPLLGGRTDLVLDASRDDTGLTTVRTLSLDGRLNAQFQGTVAGDGKESLEVDGDLNANVPTLSALNGLSGMSLGGSVTLNGTVSGDVIKGPMGLQARANANSLRIGNPTLDPFLGGNTSLVLDASRTNDGTLLIRQFELDGSSIDGTVTGQYSGSAAALRLQVSVAGFERLVPDLPGTVRVGGSLSHSGGPWQLDLDGSGPGGIGVTADGSIAQNFRTANLDLRGSAPLGIANARLSPQSISGTLGFDLRVNGPLALSSISGQATTQGARLAVPQYNIALERINGGVTLAGGRAEVDLGARLSTGGRIQIRGPIRLEAPFVADIVAELDALRLQQANLIETTANGRVEINGPLTGGAAISGEVDLGAVEVRVPNIGPSYRALDGLKHVGMPADVARTLTFAQLDEAARAESAAAGPAYPIDLTINAPNRIFVRGRGLDAELGGSLRVTGTTAALEPVGAFELVRGRLDLLGRRLDLTEGSVFLRGSFDPILRFSATTTVEDTDITISIAGPASEPELTVTSSPSLPQDEALAFFLFGQSATDLSPVQAVQLAAAIRTLSGQGGLGIQENLRSGLGVDDLDIGTNDDGTAQARVGKYISDNIYTDVTVDADGESEINLNLTVTPSLTVRGRASSDGSSGLGLFFEKDY